MKKTAFTILACSTLIHFAIAQPNTKKAELSQVSYFSHDFKPGEKFGTIFSRTIAVTGDNFQQSVSRVSGTGNYTVTGTAENQPDFDAVFLYDGRPEIRGKTGIRDSGRTLMYNGKPYPNTDGSGLSFNPLLWGTPPAKLKKGDFWDVSIDQPWELGGSGRQRVEVIDIDPATQIIRLKREGDGDGAFAGDRTDMEITSKGQLLRVKVTPGKNHWIGYTTFKNGIVIADELLVTRPLTLTNDTQHFEASQRQYILLNQMAEN